MKEKNITFNGQTKTLAEWATHLNIDYPVFCYHVRNHGPSKAIEKMADRTKNITNPATRETRTAIEWGKVLGLCTKSFKRRVTEWGILDPRTFLSKDDVQELNDVSKSETLHLQIARRKNQKLCKHPDSGIEGLACDWAKYYGVPLIEFYRATKDFDKDLAGLHRYFENRRKSA